MGGGGKLKILFVGPEGCGKSCLVNVLAEVTSAQATLPPCQLKTVGCRILELDEGFDEVVELWDIAGNCSEKCFPALRKNVVGVVFCYNPEVQSQIEQIVDTYYEAFSPRATGLPASAYMMCQITRESSREYAIPQKLAFAGIQNPVLMSWADVLNMGKPAFDKYLERVMKLVKERQRQEEEDVMRMG